MRIKIRKEAGTIWDVIIFAVTVIICLAIIYNCSSQNPTGVEEQPEPAEPFNITVIFEDNVGKAGSLRGAGAREKRFECDYRGE